MTLKPKQQCEVNLEVFGALPVCPPPKTTASASIGGTTYGGRSELQVSRPKRSGRLSKSPSQPARHTGLSSVPNSRHAQKPPRQFLFAHAAHCAEQPSPLPGTYLLAGRRREIAARVTQSCRLSFLLPSSRPASSAPRSSGTSEPVTQLPGGVSCRHAAPHTGMSAKQASLRLTKHLKSEPSRCKTGGMCSLSRHFSISS